MEGFRDFVQNRFIENPNYVEGFDPEEQENITLWERFNMENLPDCHREMLEVVFNYAWKAGYFYSNK